MAEYHFLLKKLEELVETRTELITDGSKSTGVEKSINVKISKLLEGNSMPSRADEYYRRLKIVRQQLGGFAVGHMDALIGKQEGLLGHTKPNVGRPRSPKFSPAPVIETPKTVKASGSTKTATPFAWENPLSSSAQPFAWPATPASQPQATPPTVGAWTTSTRLLTIPVSQVEPVLHVPGAWSTSNHGPAQRVVTSQSEPGILRQPPALFIAVLEMRSRKGKYRSDHGYDAMSLKIGGTPHADKYAGFTHWLLSDPKQVGAVMWSRESSLVIMQSRDLGHDGDILHIQSDSKDDAANLARYMQQWYGVGDTQVVEVPRKTLRHAFKSGIP
ncbi:MAG: hypothetical protein L6R35_004855 [Caloplaca aegaea]|nr:MAG: hypothetical protein L6R35_004855 [Caloplaca aegaea]